MKRFASAFAVRALLVLTVALGASACEREDPTTVGGELVQSGSVRTFEYTLDASNFLVRDTAFSAFRPPVSNFLIIANSYKDALNSHALMRFAVDPIILVLNASGQTVVDSTPKLQSGRIRLPVDSLGVDVEGPVLLRLYRVAESWDSASVTWTVRQRTANTNVLWGQPGGTRGALIDTVTYAGGDTISFNVDTVTLKQWRDDPSTANGVMITAETPHSRIRTGAPLLHVVMRTSIGDCAVTVVSAPIVTRFITDPAVPAASPDPRVGGVPNAFRSIFEVRPDLADISVPCPFFPGCSVKLRSTSIASAQLMLQPVPSPAGFVPEIPMTILAYTLLPTPQIPLVRSPLGQQSGFLTVGPSSFQSGTGVQPATPLNVTSFVRDLVTPLDTTAFNSRYLVLLQGVPSTFGYASFSGQPKLRLRLSVAQEIQLP